MNAREADAFGDDLKRRLGGQLDLDLSVRLPRGEPDRKRRTSAGAWPSLDRRSSDRRIMV